MSLVTDNGRELFILYKLKSQSKDVIENHIYCDPPSYPIFFVNASDKTGLQAAEEKANELNLEQTKEI